MAGLPVINEFLASNAGGIVDDNGGTTDWIEIFNAGNQAVNLGGYSLTDNPGNTDKFVFPNQTLGAGQYLVVFAGDDANPATGSDLYTGFGLSSSGEYVGLYDPSGAVVSEFSAGGGDYPAQVTDVSYGFLDDGTFSQPSYFQTPTPGTRNFNPVAGIVGEVSASLTPGFYDTTQSVALSTPTQGATIRYTTDGSTPTLSNGLVYSGPISISSTTNLRAVATRPGYLSEVDRTWSYLFIDDILTQSNNGNAPVGWPTNWGGNAVDYGIDPDVIAIEGEQVVRDALLAIPSWSITTDLDNLFDPQTGIYANALQDGIEWERPASVELLQPDGSEGFQVNAGIRIRGGFSRLASNPKHSFRLFFRGEYGDSELNYPIHGDEGTDVFDKIDLRTAQNYSWSKDGDSSNNFITDVVGRQNQGLAGQPYTRSEWLHLYINGQYWGLFQTQERADANFAASYLGGDSDNFDVIKVDGGPGAPYTNEATDGNLDAYERLFQQASALDSDGSTPNFVNDEAYLRAQGLNPDGSRNESYEVLLDVDNLIDYVTEILHAGNFDAPISRFLGNNRLNNYYALRDRTGDEGFQFFVHDAEHSIRDVDIDRNGPFNHSNFDSGVEYFNPQTLHQKLMANAEYRLQFADSIQEKFFNDGIYTTENLIERWDAEAAEISSAIVAESARWGDAQRNTPLLRSNWEQAVASARDNIIANRNGFFLEQLRNTIIELRDGNGNYTIDVDAPLFPDVDAPSFLIDGANQYGGQIAAGSELRLTGSGGTIYYTTDGSDPRNVGGSVNSNATIFNASTTFSTLVSSGDQWRYNDTGQDLGTAWRNPNFNDNAWATGTSELGYGDPNEPNTTVLSYGSNPSDKHITTYFRNEFNVGDSPELATLRIKRDDGVVVYINGTEIFRDNLPSGPISFSTTANSPIGGSAEQAWIEFSFDPSLLNSGTNTIAAEIHQVSGTSSDITFDAEIIVGNQTSASAPEILDSSTRVQSRVLAADGTWSALSTALFVTAQESASSSNLRITELNYNPLNRDAEFIEIQNITPTVTGAAIDLTGVVLTDGPSAPFEFPAGSTLEPQEYAIIVRDLAAFNAANPGFDQSLILGEYAGGLSNSGEDITLLAADGSVIADFDYGDNDPWPQAADGAGASLELIDPAGTAAEDVGKYYAWQSSFAAGGTPGAAATFAPAVVINEVFAHSDAPNVDYIELRNNSAGTINVGGWYLSDAQSNLQKFQIPAGTTIAPGGYLVFDEFDFNPTPLAPGANDFALSSGGDQVWLTSTSGGTTQFVDAVSFGATFNSQSVGRTPDGQGRLVAQAGRTPGEANGAHQVSPLGITEVNYHPSDPSAAALAIDPTLIDSDLEFIELQNHSSVSIDLSQWRLRGEVDLDFSAQSLAAGETVVLVSFDPNDALNTNRTNAFRAHYGIGTGVTLVGNFSGTLSNGFGRVALQRAETVDPDPTLTTWALADELIYDDVGPWPTADGTGISVNRIASNLEGNAATSWTGAAPSPGSTSLASFAPEVSALIRDNGERLVRPDLFSTVEVVFDGDVNVSKNDLTLVNDTLGTNVNLSAVSFGWDPLTFTATWDFTTAAALDAAYYSVVLSDQITGSTGIALDGDSDQTAGDDYSTQVYVAIPGDFDLDGQVTLSIPNLFTRINTGDVARTRANVGQAGGRVNWASGDYDASGSVSLSIPNLFTRVNTGDVAVARANVGRDVRPTATAKVAPAFVSAIPVAVPTQNAVVNSVATSDGTTVEPTVAATVTPVLAKAVVSQEVVLGAVAASDETQVEPTVAATVEAVQEVETADATEETRAINLPIWHALDDNGQSAYVTVVATPKVSASEQLGLSGAYQDIDNEIDALFADEADLGSADANDLVESYDFNFGIAESLE